MLHKILVKAFRNIGALLFRCSLLPFKCCNFKVLELSINKKILSKQSSVTHLFISFAFAIKQSFRVMMFQMVASCLSLFKLDTTSTVDFAFRSGDRSKSRSFVPTIKSYGFSLKGNFKSTTPKKYIK